MQRKSSMRMGTISLFALIITICLAIMSMLSYSTASSQYLFAIRQAQTVDMNAYNNRVAQKYVSYLAQTLYDYKANNTSLNNPNTSSVLNDLESNANSTGVIIDNQQIDREQTTIEQGNVETNIENENVEQSAIEQRSNINTTTRPEQNISLHNYIQQHIADVESKTFNDFNQSNQTYNTDITSSYDNGIITAHFISDNRITLEIKIEINDNATYTINSWKTGVVWEEGNEETLWIPS